MSVMVFSTAAVTANDDVVDGFWRIVDSWDNLNLIGGINWHVPFNERVQNTVPFEIGGQYRVVMFGEFAGSAPGQTFMVLYTYPDPQWRPFGAWEFNPMTPGPHIFPFSFGEPHAAMNNAGLFVYATNSTGTTFNVPEIRIEKFVQGTNLIDFNNPLSQTATSRTYRLDNPYIIQRVVLEGTQGGGDITVSISDDNTNWTPIYTGALVDGAIGGVPNSTTPITFPLNQFRYGRYIRFEFNANAGIGDIHVFGNLAPVITANLAAGDESGPGAANFGEDVLFSHIIDFDPFYSVLQDSPLPLEVVLHYAIERADGTFESFSQTLLPGAEFELPGAEVTGDITYYFVISRDDFGTARTPERVLDVQVPVTNIEFRHNGVAFSDLAMTIDIAAGITPYEVELYWTLQNADIDLSSINWRIIDSDVATLTANGTTLSLTPVGQQQTAGDGTLQNTRVFVSLQAGGETMDSEFDIDLEVLLYSVSLREEMSLSTGVPSAEIWGDFHPANATWRMINWDATGDVTVAPSATTGSQMATVTATNPTVPGSGVVSATFTQNGLPFGTAQTMNVTVIPEGVAVEDMTLVQSNAMMSRGAEFNLNRLVNFVPANATNRDIAWDFSGNVVSIDSDGVLRAENQGVVEITISSIDDPSLTQTFTVEVIVSPSIDVNTPYGIDFTPAFWVNFNDVMANRPNDGNEPRMRIGQSFSFNIARADEYIVIFDARNNEELVPSQVSLDSLEIRSLDNAVLNIQRTGNVWTVTAVASQHLAPETQVETSIVSRRIANLPPTETTLLLPIGYTTETFVSPRYDMSINVPVQSVAINADFHAGRFRASFFTSAADFDVEDIINFEIVSLQTAGQSIRVSELNNSKYEGDARAVLRLNYRENTYANSWAPHRVDVFIYFDELSTIRSALNSPTSVTALMAGRQSLALRNAAGAMHVFEFVEYGEPELVISANTIVPRNSNQISRGDFGALNMNELTISATPSAVIASGGGAGGTGFAAERILEMNASAEAAIYVTMEVDNGNVIEVWRQQMIHTIVMGAPSGTLQIANRQEVVDGQSVHVQLNRTAIGRNSRFDDVFGLGELELGYDYDFEVFRNGVPAQLPLGLTVRANITADDRISFSLDGFATFPVTQEYTLRIQINRHLLQTATMSISAPFVVRTPVHYLDASTFDIIIAPLVTGGPGISPPNSGGGGFGVGGGSLIDQFNRDEDGNQTQGQQPSVVFTDIGGHGWARDAILELYGMDVVQGVGGNRFAPNNNVTRAQFAAMLVRAFNLTAQGYGISFVDVDENEWYNDYIRIATINGIIIGHNYMARPNDFISRQEMAVMLVRMLSLTQPGTEQERAGLDGFADSGDIAYWAYDAAEITVGTELIQGLSEDSFAPLLNATRAQAAVVIYRMINFVD